MSWHGRLWNWNWHMASEWYHGPQSGKASFLLTVSLTLS
uniref:Uncharacterized protein n=1 Tax=Rhizophora mucronata TaxID=61149 RepID=A0A2P2JHK7_RHIMU